MGTPYSIEIFRFVFAGHPFQSAPNLVTRRTIERKTYIGLHFLADIKG